MYLTEHFWFWIRDAYFTWKHMESKTSAFLLTLANMSKWMQKVYYLLNWRKLFEIQVQNTQVEFKMILPDYYSKLCYLLESTSLQVLQRDIHWYLLIPSQNLKYLYTVSSIIDGYLPYNEYILELNNDI